MLADTLFDDVGDMLQRWRQLLKLIVAKRDIIRDVALIARCIQRLCKLRLSFFVFVFFIKNAAFGD